MQIIGIGLVGFGIVAVTIGCVLFRAFKMAQILSHRPQSWRRRQWTSTRTYRN